MEGEKDEFAVVNEIYSQLTEKNKENLIRVAEELLEAQKDDRETEVDEADDFLIHDEKGV